MNPHALIEALEQSRDAVLAHFEAPEAELGRAYGPGKWTARQILHHLADAEFVYLWRVCRAIAESGAPVAGFDQDAWAAALDYHHRPLDVSRSLFKSSRAMLLHCVVTLSGDAWTRTVRHSEAGVIPLDRLVQGHAKHTAHHLEQIEAARAGREWTP
jgi:hypothetical protein